MFADFFFDTGVRSVQLATLNVLGTSNTMLLFADNSGVSFLPMTPFAQFLLLSA